MNSFQDSVFFVALMCGTVIESQETKLRFLIDVGLDY